MRIFFYFLLSNKKRTLTCDLLTEAINLMKIRAIFVIQKVIDVLAGYDVLTLFIFRVEQRSQRATTPSGSHRVLLKLKKMSSANRPKSMHEANQNNSESAKNSSSTTDQSESNNQSVPQSEKVKKKSSSQLPTSKSMHGFYNRTWNERSLSKYANEHNYENVYNNQQCPNYENVYNNGGSHRGHGGCHFEAGNSADSCEGCVISQLTCSPRSARARLTQYVISTDYRRMMAKYLILGSPNSYPNPK